MNIKPHKLILGTAVLLLGIAAGIVLFKNHNLQKPAGNQVASAPANTNQPNAVEPVNENANPTTNTTPANAGIAANVLLKVPFTPQAPTGNWDELHNEACEEASAIMANVYFSGMTQTKLDPAYVETEITKLTKWQQDTFGYNLDTTAQETAEFMEKVYGLHTQLIKNFTEADVKNALSNNQLVVISENGRLLHNPNYKQPGPIHHMLILVGYRGDTMITNDSGTRNGLHYEYSFSTIYDAAADWSHADNTTHTDQKVAIIVSK